GGSTLIQHAGEVKRVKFSIPDNFPVVYSDDHPALRPLRERGEIALYSTRQESPAALVERLRGAVAAINVRAYSKFTDDVFAALPDLKFVTVMGTGTDNVDLVSLEDLLRQSDVVSLFLRASPRTAKIIGQRELDLMKPTAYLVNGARGALVDEDALFSTLKARKIAGAAIDVFQTEPLPATSPLLTLDNVVLTPHVAWVTDAGTDRMARHPVENILAFLEGKPKFVVNP